MARPELHFAHANGIPSAVYRAFHEGLAEAYDVRSVPALGIDPRFPVDDGWKGLVDQVVDSVRTRCSTPVVAVGHSLGAVTTFLAAHRHPELFEAVVLLDPPVMDGFRAFVFGALKRIGRSDRIGPAAKSRFRRADFASRDAARAALGTKGLFRAFAPECFDDYLLHAFRDTDAGVTLTIPVATEVGIFRSGPHSFSHVRGRLRVPAVVLAGSTSELAQGGEMARFAARYGLDYAVVEGGHMFPLERPRETAAEVVERLARLSVRAA